MHLKNVSEMNVEIENSKDCEQYLNHPRGPDTRYAWFVGVFAALYVFFSWCAISSIPVLYVLLMKSNPSWTREKASWPLTIMTACMFTGSALYGYLAKKFSEQKLMFGAALLSSISVLLSSCSTHNLWALIITLGLFHGMGLACSTCVPLAVISQYFIKYRATAMSMYSMSAALSGLVYPPLAEALSRIYSLPGVLIIMSVISVGQVLSAIICKPAPWKYVLHKLVISEDSTVSQKQSDDKLAARPYCSLFLLNTCMTNALSNFIIFGFILILVDFEIDNGVESLKGATLVMVMCIGWLVASIVVGPLIDRGANNDRYVIFSSCVIQTLGLLITVSSVAKGNYWFQSVGCFLAGWGQGSRPFVMSVMISKRYSAPRAPLAYAFMNLSCFAPFLARTPLIGLIRDNLGTYDYLIYLFAILDIWLAIDWFFVCLLTKN